MHISRGLRAAGRCVGLQQLCEGLSCVESSVVALASWTQASEVLGHRLLPSHCLAAFSVLPLVHVLLWCQLPVPLWEGAAALCHVWDHCSWREGPGSASSPGGGIPSVVLSFDQT